MDFTVAYKGRSGLSAAAGGMSLSFAPNLRRDRVSFVGDLRFPLRFREAVSALHAVVVSDLKYRPKDRSAYQEYLKQVRERENAIRRMAFQKAREELRAVEPEPMPAGLEPRFKTLREKYWSARLRYSDYLSKNDPALWRLLVPCDPVITVAPDVLFFECFSKDESSYGCLTVDRDAFAAQGEVAPGHDQRRLLAGACTRSSSGCAPTGAPASRSIRPASRWRPKGRPITARRRSTCRRRGCAGSCSSRRR